jgi:hypothetical protein
MHMKHSASRIGQALTAALVVLALVAVPVFAQVTPPDYDFSADLTSGLAGLVAAVAAMVAVVFGIALSVKLIPIGSKLALRFLHFIRG